MTRVTPDEHTSELFNKAYELDMQVCLSYNLKEYTPALHAYYEALCSGDEAAGANLLRMLHALCLHDAVNGNMDEYKILANAMTPVLLELYNLGLHHPAAKFYYALYFGWYHNDWELMKTLSSEGNEYAIEYTSIPGLMNEWSYQGL